MKRSAPPLNSLTIPTGWTPDQALVVLELLDTLRQAVWDCYGEHLLETRCDRSSRRSKKRSHKRDGRINSSESFDQTQSEHPNVPEVDDDEIPF